MRGAGLGAVSSGRLLAAWGASQGGLDVRKESLSGQKRPGAAQGRPEAPQKFPAILWMRGLSEYLARLPARLHVSLVGRFWWTDLLF